MPGCTGAVGVGVGVTMAVRVVGVPGTETQ
jgi:hypothetical protein